MPLPFNTMDGAAVTGSYATLAEAQAAAGPAEAVYDASTSTFHVTTGLTIQAAINSAISGDTINVGAGTFTEQLLIDGKSDLTIVGAGDSTIIELPDGAALSGTTFDDGRPRVAVVEVSGDSSDITIQDVKVDGGGKGDQLPSGTGADLEGILVHNSAAVIDDVTVTGVRDPLDSNGNPQGNQRGNAIVVLNDDTTARSVSIENSTIEDFQKTGIVATGVGLTAIITDNDVTGAGYLDAANAIAQNGIQITDGVAATVTGNTIADIGIIRGDATTVGVMVIDAAPSSIMGNIFKGAEDGTGLNRATTHVPVYVADTDDAVVTGNTFNDLVFGVVIDGLSDNPTFIPNTISKQIASVTTLNGAEFFATHTTVIGIGNDFALSISGTSGSDFFIGTEFGDDLLGLDGDDNIFADMGDDTVDGGNGDDYVAGDDGNDSLIGGKGSDTVDGGIGNDTLDGGNGGDILDGWEGDDLLVGGNGADTMDGGDDNDTLDGGSGANEMTGGLGNDTFQFLDSQVNSTNTITDFTQGEDQIELLGTPSAASISVDHGAGNTTITYGGGQIVLEGVTNLTTSDFVGGLPGTFILGTSASDAGLAGTAGADIIDGLAKHDEVLGLGGDDTLIGGKGNDTLDGGADDDYLNGGKGINELTGGAGDDTFYFEESQVNATSTITDFAAGDQIELDGNAASATISIDYGLGQTTITYGSGSIVLDGYTDISAADFVGGVTPGNFTVGTDADDALSPTGASVVDGLKGHDLIVADAGLFDDHLIGGRGNDTIIGGQGNDVLFGGQGINTLVGGDGAGPDSFSDTFVFETADVNATTTITDFEDTVDVLRVTGVTPGDDAAILASVTQVGADTTFVINGQTQVLENTTATDITAADFSFEFI